MPELSASNYEVADWSWRFDAECRGHEETFLPLFDLDLESPEVPEELEDDLSDALDLCSRCPVRGECLLDAARFGDEHGVRAGMTPYVRKLLSERAKSYARNREDD